LKHRGISLFLPLSPSTLIGGRGRGRESIEVD